MKRVILILLAVSSTALVSAQVQFGVKAGYNLANFSQSGGTTEETKAKSDFSGGVPCFSSTFQFILPAT